MSRRNKIFLGTGGFLFAMFAALWFFRVPLVSATARRILRNYGFPDASFTLARLSTGGVRVRDLSFGADASLADVEIRFNLSDLLRLHRFEHIAVSGLCVRAVATADGKLVLPLVERFPRGDDKGTGPSTNAPSAHLTVVSCIARDCTLALQNETGTELLAATASVELLQNQETKYHVQSLVSCGDLCSVYFSGNVDSRKRNGELFPLVTIPDVQRAMDRLTATPVVKIPPLPFTASNLAVNVKGRLRFDAADAEQPLHVNLEAALQNLCELFLPAQNASFRIQSAKVEIDGTPALLRASFQTGLAGVRWNKVLDASDVQRMLNLRGSLDWAWTPDSQRLHAAVSSSLPGRAAAKILPRIIPFVPSFFSDGGTLHGVASLVQPKSSGHWNGKIDVKTAVARSSLPLKQGVLGAQSVSIEGTLSLAESRPESLDTRISLDDVTFYGKNLAAHCTGEATLHSLPPFTTADGRFNGSLKETHTAPLAQFGFPDGAVPFSGLLHLENEGDAGAVWKLQAAMPETAVAITNGAVLASGVAGASIRATYCSERPETTRADAELHVTNAFATVAAPSGEPPTAVLSNLCFSLPVTWNMADGLSIADPHFLRWDALAVNGLRIAPDRFRLTGTSEAFTLDSRFRVEESALAVEAGTRIPLTDPLSATVHVAVAECELPGNDPVMRFAFAKFPKAEVSLRLASDLDLAFYGKHPIVRGNVRLLDGSFAQEGMRVSGLTAEIPFLKGVSFRTLGRPFLAFTNAVSGKIQFQRGRAEFQVTPEEFFLEKAEIGWCDGTLASTCFHFNFRDPAGKVTFFADKVNLGQLMSSYMPVHGKMDGALYGRIPIGIEKGKLRLYDGFLYSTPGKGGSLKITDPDDMGLLLAAAGIAGDIQGPLAKALSDMDFSVLKLDLLPADSLSGDSTLRITVTGKSNNKDWPAPVNLQLNLHGPLEAMVNMGLGLGGKGGGHE